MRCSGVCLVLRSLPRLPMLPIAFVDGDSYAIAACVCYIMFDMCHRLWLFHAFDQIVLICLVSLVESLTVCSVAFIHPFIHYLIHYSIHYVMH